MGKQIIIDGCDVSGCEWIREVEYKEMPICMNYYNHLPNPPKGTEWQYCAGNINCNYKNWKRKEQESKVVMTDKQIIIDGCDVSGCVYRAEEKCILKDDECHFFPNCDHKQLKRKEQECEELKVENKKLKEELLDLKLQISYANCSSSI